MTVYTFKAFYFILNNRTPIHRCFLMAFITGYRCMLPFQRKGSFSMVKITGSPGIKPMAARTIRDTILFKL